MRNSWFVSPAFCFRCAPLFNPLSLQSIYLLTSLISLPSSPTQSTTTLLDTLPSFAVFSRLFDSVFLVAAGAVFVVRYIDRKIRVEDGISAQYV